MAPSNTIYLWKIKKELCEFQKKAAIFIGIIIILGIIAWIFFAGQQDMMYPTSSGSGGTQSVMAPQSAKTSNVIYPDYDRPYYQNDPSAEDTREFMKVYYNTEIRTRDVKDVTRDVKSAIRDVDGRIDNLNESPKYAYISFVVPKSKFENFKEEIEDLAHKKLIIENTSSSNLLGQKQNIEEQEKNAKSRLAELKKELDNLNKSHAAAVKTFQNSINANALELIRVRDAMAKTSDQTALAALKAQETNLVKNSANLTQNLNSENQSFNNQSQNLKAQIENTDKELENVAERDEDFTDNIETVSGSISVQWVSVWQLAKAFSPIHPIWEIVIILLLVGYLLKRKNYLPGIEFV
ncbi:MAG: hypothetical protein M3M85_00035 [bacterium]|nr:hypothetical protein [bacterium]